MHVKTNYKEVSMDTLATANIIIRHFIDRQDHIRNMKLQKLLYFSCGWYSAYHDDWLINDDFYAWPYGPVCPRVYHELSTLGSHCIEDEIKTEGTINSKEHEKEYNIINQVIEKYGVHSDWELSDITHKASTPWSKTITEHHIGAKIEQSEIRNHYKSLIPKN